MQTISHTQTANYIGGQIQPSTSGRHLDVISPLTGQILSQVVLSNAADLDQAVKAAQAAYPSWSGLTLKERVQIIFRFRSLLEQHRSELIQLIHTENGKTPDEAAAEVDKGIELCEFACSLPQIVADQVQEVSRGVECRVSHKPLGVVAAIVPFNFPLMVPMWSVPNAIALGNCMILKPSEVVPLSAMRMGELLAQAGLPAGVFNIVNGDREIVEAICDHPQIQAVSFVGSTAIAKVVYKRSTANLKRCTALGGAKNHLIVLPDAAADMAASNIAASMSGCAGQRCMAASAMIAVGNSQHIIDKLCDEARKIQAGKNLGAVISAAAKARIERYITEAEQQGAKILVDGRNTFVEGKEGGFYVNPTIIDYVSPDMAVAKEEIFGPVIAIIRSNSIEEAVRIENNSPYGNAAAVFTQNGAWAKYVMENASAGMIGVNVGVPVPREPFSFGGWNESKFGAHDITGHSSIEFWTQLKKTTIKWNAEARTNWMS